MLPDWPAQKAKLSERWDRFFWSRFIHHSGFIRMMRHQSVHEGRGWSSQDESGAAVESEYEEIRTEFEYRSQELAEMPAQRLAKEIDRLAEDMARQMTQAVLQKIDSELHRTQRVFKESSGVFTKETLLSGLEHIEIDFNADGSPRLPIVVMHPTTAEGLGDLDDWEKDTDFKAKFDDIMDLKREAWRDRESRRRLVG